MRSQIHLLERRAFHSGRRRRGARSSDLPQYRPRPGRSQSDALYVPGVSEIARRDGAALPRPSRSTRHHARDRRQGRGVQTHPCASDAQLPSAAGVPHAFRGVARIARQEDRRSGRAGANRCLPQRRRTRCLGGGEQGAQRKADDGQTVLLPERPDLQRSPPALWRRIERRGRETHPVRIEYDRMDGIPGLLPHRMGLYPRGSRNGRVGRTGPWFGSRIGRGLLSENYQHRSAEIRPAVRAFPESRAYLPAGCRCRFRRGRPRRRAALLRAQVRAETRGPDRDVRYDGAQAGDPRRGPRAEAGPLGERPAGQTGTRYWPPNGNPRTS